MSEALRPSPSGPYLLDTNVVSARLNPGHKHHAPAEAFLDSLPGEAFVMLAPVNVTELLFGALVARSRGRRAADKFLWMNFATAHEHARIRHRVAKKCLPKALISHPLGDLVEEWPRKLSSQKLEIHDGDVWLAAVAVERALTLVTFEERFVRFREADHPGLDVRVLPKDAVGR